MADEGTHPSTHNKPPTDLELLVIRLGKDHADLTKRQVDLLDAETRMPTAITDDAAAGKAGDFMVQLQTAIDEAEKRRRAEQSPFEQMVSSARNFFVMLADPLAAAKTRVNDRAKAYQRDKADRLRREAEEKRKAEEAEAKRKREEAQKAEDEARAQLAAAKKAETPAERDALLDSADRSFVASQDARRAVATAQVGAERATRVVEASKPDLTRTRGSYGSVQSLRRDWKIEVTNLDLVAKRYLVFDEAAAMRDVRKAEGKITIRGCKITETDTLAVRK